MRILTEHADTKSLKYTNAQVAPPSKIEINTKSQLPAGRTVVTTKTSGSIELRYAPKQPK